MKRFVLIVVCILFLTVFATLDYMLWDRDNKIKSYESLNYSKNVSIDALGEKIKSLDDANKQLKNNVSQLEQDNKRLSDKNNQLAEDKLKSDTAIDYRNDVISMLKQAIDPQPFEAIIKKWADSIDKGQYQVAYGLQSRDSLSKDGLLDLNDFTLSYKNTVKSMKVKSITLNTEGIPFKKKGDIVFKVVLDVKKVGNSYSLFNDGSNEVYFTMDLNELRNGWAIVAISNTP